MNPWKLRLGVVARPGRLGRLGMLISVVALALMAFAACAPSQPPASQPAPYFSATDVSMDSPTDGWVVGKWITPGKTVGATTAKPALAHYQQGQWRLAPASVTGNHHYQLVRMLSPTDGWAVGYTIAPLYGDEIFHYDGVHWRLVFAPASIAARSISIADLEMFSPAIGWAVGEDGILQFAHGVWTNVTASLPPPPADWLSGWSYPGLHGVATVSSAEAWAAGDGGVIWRYDGAQWRIVASPYFPNDIFPAGAATSSVAASKLSAAALQTHPYSALFAMQMQSEDQGWSIGGPNATTLYYPNHWGPAVIEQDHAGTWRIAHTLSGYANVPSGAPTFASLAMLSAQDGWVAGAWVHFGPSIANGDQAPGPGPKVYAPLLLHYTGGQWQLVKVSPAAT